MRLILVLLPLILPGLVLSACTRQVSTPLLGPVPSRINSQHLQGTLVDLRMRQGITLAHMVTAVAYAHVVAVGEEHYHPDIQAFELHLLKALVHQRPQHVALGMEFLERDAQATVDAYLLGTIDQETFQTRLKASSSFMQLYFPLVHYAQQAGIPIIAMNVPRHIARQVAQQGLQQTLAALSTVDRGYVPASLAPITERYRTYFLDAVAEFHPVAGEQADRFVEASYLKDATMAAALAAFLEKHPSFTVLAIAGRFHFDYGIAIPALLQQYRQQIIIRRLSTMALPPDHTIDIHDLAAQRIADYLYVFPPTPATSKSPDT